VCGRRRRKKRKEGCRLIVFFFYFSLCIFLFALFPSYLCCLFLSLPSPPPRHHSSIHHHHKKKHDGWDEFQKHKRSLVSWKERKKANNPKKGGVKLHTFRSFALEVFCVCVESKTHKHSLSWIFFKKKGREKQAFAFVTLKRWKFPLYFLYVL